VERLLKKLNDRLGDLLISKLAVVRDKDSDDILVLQTKKQHLQK
jgi:hypothetical protein